MSSTGWRNLLSSEWPSEEGEINGVGISWHLGFKKTISTTCCPRQCTMSSRGGGEIIAGEGEFSFCQQEEASALSRRAGCNSSSPASGFWKQVLLTQGAKASAFLPARSFVSELVDTVMTSLPLGEPKSWPYVKNRQKKIIQSRECRRN